MIASDDATVAGSSGDQPATAETGAGAGSPGAETATTIEHVSLSAYTVVRDDGMYETHAVAAAPDFARLFAERAPTMAVVQPSLSVFWRIRLWLARILLGRP